MNKEWAQEVYLEPALPSTISQVCESNFARLDVGLMITDMQPLFDLYIYLAMVHGLQDLSSLTGTEPSPLAVKAQSLNHWTASEFF